MYIKQFIAIDDTVIIMPGMVLRQPTVSITEAGHSTYIRSVLRTISIPDTPNPRRVNTMPEITSPRAPALRISFCTVKSLPSLNPLSRQNAAPG
jgi:hypothetical protein